MKEYKLGREGGHHDSLHRKQQTSLDKNQPNPYYYQEIMKHKKSNSVYSDDQAEQLRDDDFVKQVFKMTLHYRKCFFTLRISQVIFSVLFAAANIIILTMLPTTLTCSIVETPAVLLDLSEIPAELAPVQYLETSDSTVDLNFLFWLLLIYHLIEASSNIFELVQMNENKFMPVASWLFSLNGCYGLCVFIYAHVLFFRNIFQCDNYNDVYGKLIYFWLIIEICGFYISCIQSIIILTVLFFYQKRSQTFYESNADDNFKKINNIGNVNEDKHQQADLQKKELKNFHY